MKLIRMRGFRMLNLLLILFFSLIACDNNDDIAEPENPNNSSSTPILKGTGSFVFDNYVPLSNKPVQVYFHIPTSIQPNSPILFVFHGASRDAEDCRNDLIAKSNQKGFILMVPEFSSQHYPGGDSYNLGNVFLDGDHPSQASLNDESIWTFSVIEPLFDRVKQLTANQTNQYYMLGFSAGAQFVHRFIYFKPQARVNQTVAASAGWYTMPDEQVLFPYGLKESTLDINQFNSIFNQKLTVLIGMADNDPNSGGLRRNSQADVQGTNRYSRAQYFYQQSQSIASQKGFGFNWNYVAIPNVSHDFEATANFAVSSIFTF